MLTKTTLKLSLFAAVAAALAACSTAKFAGSNGSRASQDPPPAPPTATPTATSTGTETSTPTSTPTSTHTSTDTGTPTSTPTSTSTSTSTPAPTSTSTSSCTPTQQTIGAQIAFLIDNSNSNSATDCPGAKKTGTFNGTDLYTCASETNREVAVLAAYDTLAQYASAQPNNAKAKSDLAIASFPTSKDYVNGWTQESNGWVDADGNTKQTVANAMLFTRNPLGMTPYGAAMTAATDLFKSASTDARAKVFVLVTDGDPTDSDPSAVQAKADALKAQGVQIIVVTYTGDREGPHTQMMQGIDNTYFQYYGQHWYAPKYSTFADYMKALIGTGGKGGLAQTIASNGQSILVSDSSKLKDTFQSIIKTQAIGCNQ